MIKIFIKFLLCFLLVGSSGNLFLFAQDTSKSLSTGSSTAPRINGPRVFGVRPGSPLIYGIPATGNRPMKFTAEGLPKGLKIDATTGIIKGVLNAPGQYAMLLKASNALGAAEKPFKIIVGDRIALTPPMGWSSWNCFGDAIDQTKN